MSMSASAGKQFYLYVTQTVDQGDARIGAQLKSAREREAGSKPVRDGDPAMRELERVLQSQPGVQQPEPGAQQPDPGLQQPVPGQEQVSTSEPNIQPQLQLNTQANP